MIHPLHRLVLYVTFSTFNFSDTPLINEFPELVMPSIPAKVRQFHYVVSTHRFLFTDQLDD